jgi:hypothetical protein
MASKSRGSQHRTARQFKRPSPLFRWSADVGLLDRPGRAFVVGAGLMAEATSLRDLGWKVDAMETPESLAARADFYDGWREQSPGCRVLSSVDEAGHDYDVIVITHVLEFVPSPRERRRLLKSCAERLARNGAVLLSLRGWSDVNAARMKRPSGDGFVTGLGTWTRGFSRDEAEALVRSAGLDLGRGPQGDKSRTPEQVRLVCRRRIGT